MLCLKINLVSNPTLRGYIHTHTHTHTHIYKCIETFFLHIHTGITDFLPSLVPEEYQIIYFAESTEITWPLRPSQIFKTQRLLEIFITWNTLINLSTDLKNLLHLCDKCPWKAWDTLLSKSVVFLNFSDMYAVYQLFLHKSLLIKWAK